MAKLIAKYEPSLLLSVEKRNEEPDVEWGWRIGYVGKPGCLCVFESERKRPGERFVRMCCYSQDDLTTTYGEIMIDGDRLILTTRNSRYVFKIGKGVRSWQENESQEKEPSD